MTRFVLDNSVAMLWLLPQSQPGGVAYADLVLAELGRVGAVVPGLWPLEAANVVAKAQSRGVVTAQQATEFVALLGQLDLVVDPATAVHALGRTLELARAHHLSAYDAAYLELALRQRCALATLDAALAAAAEAAGVPRLGR